jgi:hypothetical protein
LSTRGDPPTHPQQFITAPPKKRKWPWVVAGVLLFLFIIGQCSSNDHNSASTSSSSSSASTSLPPPSSAPSTPTASSSEAAPTSTAPPGPALPDVKDLTINEQPGDVISATYKIGENLTDGLTKDTARYETSLILKYALAKYPNLTEVDVHGKADLIDVYGNTKLEEVATLTYSRASLDRINWGSFSTKNMWNEPIADSADIAQAFLY